MSYYLGVWNTRTAISDSEAADCYRQLNDDRSPRAKFDPRVYAFYRQLIDLYPELESLSEEEQDASPWEGSLDLSDGHVILAIHPASCERLVRQIIALAQHHGLVCFDPQAGEVHLPRHLRPTSIQDPSQGHSRDCPVPRESTRKSRL